MAALISDLGITVVGGVIKTDLSDTVSCIEMEYKWTLQDTTDSRHSKNVWGYKYYITDVKSAAKDKTYYINFFEVHLIFPTAVKRQTQYI